MSTKVGYGRNDNCPCGSGLKYKKCCLERYGKHGYHSLTCYLGSLGDIDLQRDEVFVPQKAVAILRERDTNRKVVVRGFDYFSRGRFIRVYTALACDSYYLGEVLKPDGEVALRLSGSITSWDAQTISVDVSPVLYCIDLVRMKPSTSKGEDDNGAA